VVALDGVAGLTVATMLALTWTFVDAAAPTREDGPAD
jgi:hypothetical protein